MGRMATQRSKAWAGGHRDSLCIAIPRSVWVSEELEARDRDKLGGEAETGERSAPLFGLLRRD